ncbi:hypothetical protein BKA69DRAFT_1121928 [Paraphysoderma sedebokerense]|nr:hypothetical protein BKA69DRAFT_1121928 [Paraphysoderma sedebokerense]
MHSAAVPSPPLSLFVHPVIPHSPHPLYGNLHCSEAHSLSHSHSHSQSKDHSIAHSEPHSALPQSTIAPPLPPQPNRTQPQPPIDPSSTTTATSSLSAPPAPPLPTIEDAFAICAQGKLPELKSVIENANASINVNSIHPLSGLTLLHVACSKGFLEGVNYLLENGAIIDSEDKNSETALLKAVFHGHLDIVKLLITSHANVKVKDHDGWDALHYASAKASPEMVDYLITHGHMDVHSRNSTGQTPLMVAASKNNAEIVELLLNHGADPFVRNNFNESAYDIAALISSWKVCDLISSAERAAYTTRNPLNTVIPYDPINIHRYHNTILISLHENERGVSSSLLPFSRARFLPDETMPFAFNNTLSTKSDSPSIYLPSDSDNSVFWVTDWQLDSEMFAKSLTAPEEEWIAKIPQSESGVGWFRRKRWLRVMKRKVDVTVPAGNALNINSTDEPTDAMEDAGMNDVEGDKNEYLERAERLLSGISSSYDSHDDPTKIQQMQVDLHLYQEAIEILLNGVKSSPQNSSQRQAIIRLQQLMTAAESLVDTIHNLESRQTSHQSSSSTEPSSSAPNDATPAHPPKPTRRRSSILEFLRFHRSSHSDAQSSTQTPNSPSQLTTDLRNFLTVSAVDAASPHDSAGSIRSFASQDTGLNCPICFKAFPNLDDEELENHIVECIQSEGENSASRGVRYEEYTLDQDMNGKECIICFEEFLKGTLATFDLPVPLFIS